MARLKVSPEFRQKAPAKIGISNIKQLKARIQHFGSVKFTNEVMKELAPVAEELAQDIRNAARATGAPKDIIDSIFSYSKPPKNFNTRGRRYRITGLVGVNRGFGTGGRVGPSYFEWRTKSGPGIVDRKGGGYTIVRKWPKGKIVGMSLASIWEYGSSNRYPRPFFRPTINKRVAMIRAKATAAMNRAIEAQDIRRKGV